MEGIININKEKDITSFDVIRKLRKILKTRKIGHTGTLDPLATGVLVMCIGPVTKLASIIEGKEKVYLAKLQLGFATDTLDITGTITEESEKKEVSKETFEKTIKKFVGNIEQVPPMYSALKVDGKKLYELAREGKEIERKARPVQIDYIKLHHFTGNEAIIECKVSKGTYIRTLIDDIGRELGTFATMTELQRRSVGEYNINESYTLEQIEKYTEAGIVPFLKSVEDTFDYKRIDITNEKDIKLLENGNKISFVHQEAYVKIYINRIFWGIGKVEGNKLKPHKYFNINKN